MLHMPRAKFNPEESESIGRERDCEEESSKVEKRQLDRPCSSENRLTKDRDKGVRLSSTTC
jgi:hypothetical protein